MHYSFEVQNIRCGGCANTITNKLKEINEVEHVQVDVEKKQVIVTTNSTSNTEIERLISEKLIRLGYPETGKSGSNSLKAKATSVVTCAIGKVTNKN